VRTAGDTGSSLPWGIRLTSGQLFPSTPAKTVSPITAARNGLGPMYLSRSADSGKSWSKPLVFNKEFGVLPGILRLTNGALILSYGRPGVEVRFSGDNGSTWTEPHILVPTARTAREDRKKAMEDSCGYTSLLPLGPDKCLIAYSHFHYPDRNGQERKTILTREIQVSID
jgi:hypothetical protein